MGVRDAWIEKRLVEAAAANGTRNVSQMHYARKGVTTEEMVYVARKEKIAPELVRGEVARGRAIIPANIHHKSLEPMGIGIAFKCKINSNIGNSATTSHIDEELKKLHHSVHYGADTVMDLSTGGDIAAIRKAIIETSTVPIGTVPIYEALSRVKRTEDLSIGLMLEVIEEQAEQGVDYMTIHAGVLREFVPMVRNRITGIVSRGGALLAHWMNTHKQENFLYENFDLQDIQEARREFFAGRWIASGMSGGCERRGSVCRIKSAGRVDEEGVGARRAGDGRRAGSRADGSDRAAGEEGNGVVPRSAVLHAGAAGD
jgi:phosphomethylpyrimidine synthase